MSALWKGRADDRAQPEGRVMVPMTTAQIDAVMTIEVAAYAFPWSRGNFIDSIAARYPAQLLCDPTGALLGYFVAMVGVDEMHLLNITVAPAVQGRGHARFLVAALLDLCRTHGACELWLEVRESNARARRIYERMGFAQVGVRKAYYPAAGGRREDAVVMSFKVGPAGEATDALD